ncbi:MAG: DUF2497 domain-containing protein [Hyphomicrobium sp.]|nr:DUF2497 domain-containing protein [Hyphomicrobium sp.]
MPKAAAPAPVNARIEPSFAAPSFAAMSAPAPAVVAVTAERAPAALTQPPEATPAAALSVDAQLSELLGDMVPPKALSPAVPAAAVQSAPAYAEAVAPQADIADQSIAMPFLPNPPVPAEARPAESRPGFKVSRDGYVAEKAEVSVARDPFDFDLGPSPFVKKTEEAKRTGQNAGDVKEAEPQTLAAVPPAPVFDLSALSLEHEARPAAALEMAPMAAPVVAFEMPVPSAATRFEMPSVAATLAPPVSVPSTPEPAPVSPVDVAAVDTAVEAPLIEESEVVLEETLEAPAAPAPESFESSPSPEFAPPVNSMVVHDHHRNSRLPPADLGQRTMEDAVADLLRPMLKTWLAENMPRIVERALRRELTDQLQSEHKSAAE